MNQLFLLFQNTYFEILLDLILNAYSSCVWMINHLNNQTSNNQLSIAYHITIIIKLQIFMHLCKILIYKNLYLNDIKTGNIQTILYLRNKLNLYLNSIFLIIHINLILHKIHESKSNYNDNNYINR